MTRHLLALTALLCLFASAADARPMARSSPQESILCVSDNLGRQVCGGAVGRIQSQISASGQGVIGRRPAGCPVRYCGCAVSLKVFGRMVDGLNLAANWKHRFPRAHPGPGMVAARSGHVFYIVSMIDVGTALAYDPNSGGGKTRIHPRALRGYTVVDPNGNRVASR
jgi:hypothetical protein